MSRYDRNARCSSQHTVKMLTMWKEDTFSTKRLYENSSK
ncbi:hypothetical protein T05_11832 [Trichinella murrelli]|uniref:Uncharacterized protein n=1 Tax=Trichinella murrelli TaxID=144512 RepID=A0A0V0SZT6_9BILA|nr:hypothetical protein T05_11832 [Trichinella murrelli]